MVQTKALETLQTRGHAAPLDLPAEESPYEVRRTLYAFALPVMWFLTAWVKIKKALLGRKPGTNTFWFDGISSACRGIKEGAASWKALDLIYNHRFGVQGGVHGKVTDFWLGMRNAQAVRNRKKLVTSLLVQNLLDFVGEKKVRVLSLASGSAQSVMEALAILKERGVAAEAILVDIDPAALEYCRELAQRYGVQGQVTVVELDIRNILRLERSLCSWGKFHVAEIVGWLEYDKDKRIRGIFGSLQSLLVENGALITCTIDKNPERWFLHWVINWEMIYRSKKELSHLLKDSGFPEGACSIVTEPQGIFHVAVCRK